MSGTGPGGSRKTRIHPKGRTIMIIVTKTAGVVLAAAALCGIGASAAFAAPPTGHARTPPGRAAPHPTRRLR